eukprot:6188138-Ditylum_brightwellii.AAC.1
MNCGPRYSQAVLMVAIGKGPHVNAMTTDAMQLIHEDAQYQVEADFCEVHQQEDLKQRWPEKPKDFTSGSGPTDRKMGLQQAQQRVMQPSVNDTTEQLSPTEVVKDMGKVLLQLLRCMSEAPMEWHIYFSNINLSNGYWRMIVPENQRWNFCYIMSNLPGHPIRIVVPFPLQMGWRESNGHDVTLGQVELGEHFIPNGVIKLANIISEIVEVYVYDFILGAQPTSMNHLHQITQAAITAILSVFPSTKHSGHINRRELILIKKVLKGDTRWEVHKNVLDFLLDGETRTIRPPPDKLQATLEAVQELLRHMQ